jgi:hypothetical protein
MTEPPAALADLAALVARARAAAETHATSRPPCLLVTLAIPIAPGPGMQQVADSIPVEDWVRVVVHESGQGPNGLTHLSYGALVVEVTACP